MNVLKSWKEVAEYLKVSVRTAQRWKHEFGLPVHRMEGEHESGILAFPDEIEQWLTTRLKKAGGSRIPCSGRAWGRVGGCAHYGSVMESPVAAPDV